MSSAAKTSDLWQWLAVSEDRLLLHDGLVRVADLVPVPNGVTELGEEDYDLPVLDGKTPTELATIIQKECSTKNTVYASLIEYRRSALKGLWQALKEFEIKRASSAASESNTPTQSSTNQTGSFASRISLVLIFPMLKSLSTVDPGLSSETARILLESLRACEPLTLSSEPTDCIRGLESMLTSWLRAAMEEGGGDSLLVQNAASALVALGVAVGTGSLLLRTVHILQSLMVRYPDLRLLVPGILDKLLQEREGQEESSTLTADIHFLCWNYDDGLIHSPEKEGSGPRSIVFNGQFVYVTSSSAKHLLKMGSGKRGTIRGYVYASRELSPGWVLLVEDQLLFFQCREDGGEENISCSKLNVDTLESCKGVRMVELPGEQLHTVQVLSDGSFVYWLYVLKAAETIPHPITSEKLKQHPVYVQRLKIEHPKPSNESAEPRLVLHGHRLYIHRTMADIEKNSDVMKALLRSNPSYISGNSSIMASLMAQSKDDSSPLTSMGLSIKTIQRSAAFSTGSSLVLLTAPPSIGSGRGGLFGMGSHSSKALCYNFCYSLHSGQLLSQVDLQSTSQLHCSLTRGAAVENMAACYDPRNLCVWTANDDWIDVWDCAGKVKVSACHLDARLGRLELNRDTAASDPNTMCVSSAISILLRHIGVESCRLVPGLEFSTLVVHSLPLSFLSQCCDLLESSMAAESWGNAQAVIVTLQAVLPAFFNSPSFTEEQLLPLKERVRSLVWSLLMNRGCPSPLLTEVRRIISRNAEVLFLSNENSPDFVTTLLEAEDSSSPELVSLRNELLTNMASSIQTSFSLTPAHNNMTTLVREAVLTNSIAALRKAFKLSEEQLGTLTALNPVSTPSLHCASMLMSLCLRRVTFVLKEVSKKETEATEGKNEDDNKCTEELQAAREALLAFCEDLSLFNSCRQTLQELIQLASTFSSSGDTETTSQEQSTPTEEQVTPTQLRLSAVDRVLKSSVLGCVLQPLLVVISEPSIATLQMANTLQKQLSSLAQLTAQSCGLLYGTESLEVRVPSPWAIGRTIETIHPVRDNYKFKETVTFPGAKNLFLKFDARCSSQYDYDKVVVYAGENASSPKVAEYGGNTHGFGSRSVLGKGWPKDLVKVDGDSVTVMFEMKSGREHSTPDKAMWGFAVTIRPQESADDTTSGLPFITDLYLSLITVCCSLIGRLYAGPHLNEDERKCKELMEYPLLHRCQWPVDQGSPDNLPLDSPFFSPSPHKPLPPVVVGKLRGVCNKPRPPLRPSHLELIRPDTLEDVIVTVCLKQYGVGSPLELLGEESESVGHTALLENIFTRINGLERRLQALAELESNWWHDVQDMCKADNTSTTEAFFYSLMQHESSLKSFELLCVLKKVEVSHGDLLSTAQQLQDLLELDVERRRSGTEEPLDYTPVTRTLVKGVQERAELLFNVTIAHNDQPSAINSVVKENLLSPEAAYNRSISLPPSTVDITLRRQRSWGPKSSGKLALLDLTTSADQSNLLEQIFHFIGSKPEEAASCESFLSAASQHWRRGVCRVRALGHLQQLLTSDYVGLAVDQLLASVGVVLQKGPGVADIACGGMGEKVREVFGSVMQAVVELASKQPASCINTIAMLCIVPYTRLEEGCLVRSGLVKLLDHLCSLVDAKKPLEMGGAADESLHRVTSLSWASFQVLAEQCVSWENQNTTLSSGLAQQVSHLLTNHLSRAMERLVVSEGGASEGLQDALSLLLGLAKSQMGRAILSQPACVSKLLLLLTDQRPSPKLVLIALQLCRIALPLMSVADCSRVEVPPHPLSPTGAEGGQTVSGVAGQIVGLFLSKLAEYIVPDSSQVSTKQISADDGGSLEEADHPPQGSAHKEEEFEQEGGQASVYVYKRENENAADILQPLISQDPRQFRLGGAGDRMQQVMAMDRALTDHGVAEVTTDSYRGCVRRALRWANMGFTVSVGPPSHGTGDTSGSGVDKKKARSEAAARKKNIDLLKTDPPRPFVSGHVAYSLASEVIGLLNGLLTEPGAVDVWGEAIKKIILDSLASVPQLSPKLSSYTKSVSETVSKGGSPSPPGDLLSSACIANATFAALGGFKESIRPGLTVQVVGEGLEGSYGVIQSISERRGLANVQFKDDELCFGPNKTLEVPISRLLPPHKETLPLEQLGVQKELCSAIMSLLDTITPSPTHANSNADANTSSLGLCRLFAEMRTRACVALSHHVQDSSFAQLFLMESSEGQSCVERLSELARGSNPGLRVSMVEQHCQGLRMLYRDCSRPAPPRVEKVRREPKHFKLDLTKVWPPVTSCSFTHNLTCLTYQGPSGFVPHAPANLASGETPASGQPKGVVIYTNIPIPVQAPSFYWELEVAHLGESSADTAHIAMGYSPPPGPSGGEQWSYPVGSCFMRSSGRACQVTGDNSMEWNTFRLDSPLKTGDVIGCGWIQGEEGRSNTVYFTLNGEKQGSEFKEAPSNMYPFVHVQKKGIRVRVNFGDRVFVYTAGTAHREAANILEESESAESVMAHFEVLPFDVGGNDSEEEEGKEVKEGTAGGDLVELGHTGPPTRKLKPPIATVGYDHEASQGYHTTASFDTMLEGGPLVRPGGGVAESQDVEEEEEEGPSTAGEEDLHALLVKAWEAKVFPVIQRRFRNDQERKSGLEQIKGALQLGMESIAQETVEFLYEENGGIPKDLGLPTMDDVKAELGKFTISRIRKGSAVVIQKELPYSRCGVRAMQKTQGLTGIVMEVDHSSEIIQIECYLQNEGALVRFWYPVVYLERPPPGYRKSLALRGADAANMLVHRELLLCERSLASLYCRRALLRVKQVLENSREEVVNHLSLVSAECFAEPLSNGLSTTTSPDLAPSPAAALNTLTLSSLHTFYSDVDRIRAELLQAIQVSAGDLVGLSRDLCECLQRTPESFSSTELKVTETKEAFDVTHPDAAFIVVSCVDDRSATSKSNSFTYKYPWARILCYRGGQGKGGSQQTQEVARYPNKMAQSSSNQYCGPTYPTLVLPFSRIHVKLGGCSTRPNKSLSILALPAGFPLALGLSETLSHYTVELCKKENSSKHLIECVKALCICLESLCKVVARLSCLQLLKILLLHQMSDILWTLCHVDNIAKEGEKQKMYSFPSEFLQSIRQELLKVYENEISKFSGKNKSSIFPPTASVASGGSGKFSTYFQAILEFFLAAVKYQEQFHGMEILSTLFASSLNSLTVAPPPVARSTSSEVTPTTSSTTASPPPKLTELRKKLRHRRSSAKKDSQSESSSKKREDWLSTVNSSTSLLRNVVLEQSSNLLSCEASFSCQWKTKPTSRLVIVTGIDQQLKAEDVIKGVLKVCNVYGGLYRDQLYLPTQEASEDASHDKDENETKEDEAKSLSKERTAETKNETEPRGREVLVGCAVLEVCCSTQASPVSTALLSCPALKVEDSALQVCTISDNLNCGDDKLPNEVLMKYLRHKLLKDDTLSYEAKQALSEIFKSSLPRESNGLLLSSKITNNLQLFMNGLATESTESMEELVGRVWESRGNKEGLLSEEGFAEWVCEHVRLVTGEGVRAVWLGLLASGYDFHFERYGFFSFDEPLCQLTPAQDQAIVHLVDSLCRNLATIANNIEPWDLTLSEALITSQQLTPLQGVLLRDIRMRFLQLKHINNQFLSLFIVTDLRCTHPLSLGSLLSQSTPLLFYDRKLSLFHSILNATTRRSFDQAPPEIKMDPLESVSGVASIPLSTQYCQAAEQLLSVPSAQLCIPLASGGDPTYAFNVKLSGEEVHGTSGSFRHFLWQVVRELQSSVLPILLPCPSGATGLNHGRYILATGAMTFSEEKLLQFFGQLLGVAIRADMAIALDLLPCFWKSLKGEPLILTDLKEADCVTYNLTTRILECSSAEEFEEIVSGLHHGSGATDEEGLDGGVVSTHPSARLRFVFTRLDGVEEELCPGGRDKMVEYSNRDQFVQAVRDLRLTELTCIERMQAVRCGLASVVPLELLALLTPQNLDLRVCGLPQINLDYLKRHTMYQVGLMETDKHVLYFWHALESFSQDELRKFIKFACNQERIPFGHPCREGGQDQVIHVPPYPMKIAPPDGKGPPDGRYIRAETCMFMIKLPQYSSQDIMTKRLRYAIHCREDPLSG